MESEASKDLSYLLLSSSKFLFEVRSWAVSTAWRSTQPGGQMSGVGVTEVKLKYPVESSRIHLQYTEYVLAVFTKKEYV
jgi:hypothetical protein